MFHIVASSRGVTGASAHILVDKVKYRIYLRDMDVSDTIDARGMLCPLPVLKLRKRLAPVAVGNVVALLADDPAAIVDVPHFCAETGHELISVSEMDAHQEYRVRKSG